GVFARFIQVEQVEAYGYQTGEAQRCGEIKMVAQIGIASGEGTLGGLFVPGYNTYWIIEQVLVQDVGIDAGKVIVVVCLLRRFRIAWVARRFVNAPVLLDEGGVRAATV